MAFSGSVVSDDFCEAFRAEGNRISYLFKQGLVFGHYDNQTIHVIINGQSWDLLFYTWTNEIKFNSNVSQSAPLFTNQYMGGACFWIGGEQGKCDTMLFPKGDSIYKVNVTRIANNDHKSLKTLKDFSLPEQKSVSGLPERNYSFVFSDSHENRIDFVVGPTPGKSFTRFYYTFKPNGEKSFYVQKASDDRTKKTKDFDMDKDVIGIMYQWSNRGHREFGHILLLTDNQFVYWCWRMINESQVCMTQKTVTTTTVKFHFESTGDILHFKSAPIYSPQ